MRFGIIGTASIARRAFVPAVGATEHEVAAIASRDPDRAESFAAEFDIPNAYGTYNDLLDDPALDAVYIPLPNTMHAEWTIRAAERGLHVLCEKPLASDADAARRMRDRCTDEDVVLMEAFMYRYHPRTERAAVIVDEELDDVREMTATFQSPRAGELISLNPDLGGGSLMHNGCYPANAARVFLGDPRRVYAVETDTRGSGVDTQFTGILEYGDGATATVTSGYDTERRVASYRLEATNGWLQATSAFAAKADTEATLEYGVDGRHVIEEFSPVDPYRLEVEHFAMCIRDGRTPRTDGDQGVANMVLIDALYESADRKAPVTIP